MPQRSKFLYYSLEQSASSAGCVCAPQRHAERILQLSLIMFSPENESQDGLVLTVNLLRGEDVLRFQIEEMLQDRFPLLIAFQLFISQ